ncbi:META domain-containing protein [Trujillonella endophytica]|uniref:Heat shock protein HslJ n=1 Tax=Trujillonella endophytica TaxID=673521 RepID=A0A1H8RQB7_9ACTN|nr:META domain-containing protein [Trujillella endophytica]SEO68487.1 Heat shock protein HslJ [Trujillella endophytica]
MTRLLALAVLLALAAGCADPTDAAGGPDVHGAWDLVSGDVDGVPLPLPPGAAATLVAEDERLSGTAFCNSWFAGYRLDGEVLTLEPIGATQMACAEPIMAAEARFLAALSVVDRVARDGDDLVLGGPDVVLRFTRHVPEPDRELVGTRWVLDTLVDRETASSVQGEPLLQLAADGTAVFGTGCHSTTGSWRRDGDVLTVEPGASTLTGCDPPLEAQVEQVSAVLTAGATVAIDGDRLTLTAPDGRGLGYRAA